MEGCITMKQSPTAYSTIFWHFTGAPKFKEGVKIDKPGDMRDPDKIKRRKSNIEAVNILKKILDDKTLLATSKEEIIKDIRTKTFGCVCDLPLKDLLIHSKYYGKVAIGFSSRLIYKQFNPVLYINIEKLDLVSKICYQKSCSFENKFNDFNDDNNSINPKLSSGQLKNYVKITNFNESSNETFYREKEWRCLENFKFETRDVSAIIIPKKFIFEMENYLNSNDYKNVSIISWEIIKKS